MPSGRSKIPPPVLLFWFTLAGIMLLFAPQRWTGKFQLTFAGALRAPLRYARGFSLTSQTRAAHTKTVSKKQYQQLQNHLANTMQWLKQEREKVEELSGLRNRTAWQGAKFVQADIITTSANNIIINRGTNDGLTQGQFVIGDFTVIGIISAANSRTAQVKLVTDPTCKIPVRINAGSLSEEKPPADVIMQGNGKNAKIKLLPSKYKVNTKSIVFAQKRPGFLDVPVVVGTVAACDRDKENPLLWDITVKPNCNVEELQRVEIVVMNPNQ
ncbi:MAG: rod shape-determining protein MreC [Planctomycetota bacterium]|jgi:rod shape-determining protein MreC